jgi:hypothetical protein
VQHKLMRLSSDEVDKTFFSSCYHEMIFFFLIFMSSFGRIEFYFREFSALYSQMGDKQTTLFLLWINPRAV